MIRKLATLLVTCMAFLATEESRAQTATQLVANLVDPSKTGGNPLVRRSQAPFTALVDFATLADSTSTNITAPDGGFYSQVSASKTNFGVVTGGTFFFNPWLGTNTATEAVHIHGTNSDGGNLDWIAMEFSMLPVTNSGSSPALNTFPVLLVSTNPIYVGGSGLIQLQGVFHIGINPQGFVGVIMTNGVANGTNLVPFNITNSWYRYDGARHTVSYEFHGNNAMTLRVDGQSLRLTNAFVESYRPKPGQPVYFTFEVSGLTNSVNHCYVHKIAYGNRAAIQQATATRALRLNEAEDVFTYAPSNGVIHGGLRTSAATGSGRHVSGYSFGTTNGSPMLEFRRAGASFGRYIFNRHDAEVLGYTVGADNAAYEFWSRADFFEYTISLHSAANNPVGIDHYKGNTRYWRVGVGYNETDYTIYNDPNGVSMLRLTGDGFRAQFHADVVRKADALQTIGQATNHWPIAYLGSIVSTNVTSTNVLANSFRFGSGGIVITNGSGAPSFSAPIGSIYLRTDFASANNTIYIATNTAAAASSWRGL